MTKQLNMEISSREQLQGRHSTCTGAPKYPRAAGSESCGSTGSAFPPLHWHQRSPGAAEPSQNQPGAEAAALDPVQFLSLFVTWATTSGWRIREGNTQDLLGSSGTWGCLLSCSPTQGCGVCPQQPRAGETASQVPTKQA